ncbi:hypothetical protein CMV_001146 [Castanea mollissima]|uniref:ABC transmembrane type-1 domain-containing protein n=1 Tax=Castanea mollissima TaxID=60419 RepID=A0A8J4RLA3_9ROSI|nr:hypothetical protein CMV_001146 [Castanea mollissima]
MVLRHLVVDLHIALFLLQPKFGGKIIDIVSGDIKTPEQKAEAYDAVKNTIVEIFLIIIVGAISAALQTWFFSSASERVVAQLRKNLFSHLVHQEIAFFDITRTGELLSRLSEDTQIIKSAATTSLFEALRSLATAFIGLSFMFATSWKLTLFVLAVVPALSVAVRKFGLTELSSKTQAAAPEASSIAEESFGAIRIVRSFAQEGYEITCYSEKVDETFKLRLQQAKVSGLFIGGLNAASSLSVIIGVIFGANMTIAGSLTTGALTSFILYSFTVGSAVYGLSGRYTVVVKAVGASNGDQDSELELDDVWFAYPSRPNHMILKGVTLKLQPGSKVALVGPSGGGKISIVSQEPVLFNCSIEENIAYGFDGKVNSIDLENVAKMANAHEFISKFPDKYQTVVGECGVRLSGGCYGFFDEGKDCFVIAHRLSTVKSANIVAVVSDGQIVESGTHDELIANDGVYTALVRRQLQGTKTEI